MEADPPADMDYDAWFERKVQDSIASAERNQTIPDDEVSAWLDGRERRNLEIASRVAQAPCLPRRHSCRLSDWEEDASRCPLAGPSAASTGQARVCPRNRMAVDYRQNEIVR
jgi:hypothetical protein